ncbi:hypothetical protein M758_11G005100 [Ceratodon purpureus]|uniref:Uncharacterized protein n=1 Tax=Ceratodon purpureus TaxID=3225 RepID=A0A8T0G946_CERPU|nr:hypothetical protein KC19_11G006100 [Ceratodon purpureus]KAG0600071.1 hypothetical protein M758_11G005100 [Ceratodon purpureus]
MVVMDGDFMRSSLGGFMAWWMEMVGWFAWRGGGGRESCGGLRLRRLCDSRVCVGAFYALCALLTWCDGGGGEGWVMRTVTTVVCKVMDSWDRRGLHECLRCDEMVG